MKHFDDAVISALRAGLEGNVRSIAKATGMNPDILYKWLREERSPSIKMVAPIMDFLGITIKMPDEKIAEYDLVPKVEALAGAGASLETSGKVRGSYAFRKDFLATKRIPPNKAVLMEVIGDSMEPTFLSGDTVLIDESDTRPVDGRVYIVTLGEELKIKRVFHSVSGLILRSDNPQYPDIPVAGPDLETFRIHGHVRWCGKNLA